MPTEVLVAEQQKKSQLFCHAIETYFSTANWYFFKKITTCRQSKPSQSYYKNHFF